jgi:hypothetical protein
VGNEEGQEVRYTELYNRIYSEGMALEPLDRAAWDIVKFFDGRKGFNWWWTGCADEVQDEMFDELRVLISSLFPATGVTSDESLRVKSLREMRDCINTLLTNAEVIPDPRMDNATDCYAVPLDDIEDLKRAAVPLVKWA